MPTERVFPKSKRFAPAAATKVPAFKNDELCHTKSLKLNKNSLIIERLCFDPL